MLPDIVLLIVGLGLIGKGGDLFVDSSLSIGSALQVPRFIIGGTLVSLVTTTPELVVSVMASAMGDSGIALGNAIGSCICNIGLVVGTVALITPVAVDQRDFANRAAWMLGGAVLVIGLSWDRNLSRPFGALLLTLALVYLVWDYLAIRRLKAVGQAAQLEGDESQDHEFLTRSLLTFLVGAVLIILGSRVLVTSGQTLAAGLGVPSAIIGFSVIAVGTSLPELVTGITAARKGVPELSLGNIIGANVLNLLLIVGLSGTIQPLTLDGFSQWYAFPWMAIFFVLVMLFIWRNGNIGPRAGGTLLTLYGLYLAGLVVLARI